MPFCSKCGTQNSDSASVCTSCGNELNPNPNIFSSGSGQTSGFLDGIKRYIDDLMQFFDSGDFFKFSWKCLNYHLLAIMYVLLPVGLIGAAIKFHVFDMPGKMVVVLLIFLIFLIVACFLSFLAVRSRTKNFDEITESFSVSHVTLANFYDFFKVAYVHSIETVVYAGGIFLSITIFGLALCSLFAEEIRNAVGSYIMFGFILGPLLAYANIFITKIIVLFLKVFLEYLPKLFITPIRALYNLFGIIIDTRQNLWK